MQNINYSGPVRKRNRKPTQNYAEAGSYFLTSCAHEHRLLFGRIVGGFITLNPNGLMITKWWECLPGKFRYIELGDFVVMPNHFHGIVRIERPKSYREDQWDQRGEDTLVLTDETNWGGKMVDSLVDPSIPRIMQWFKTMSTNEFYRMQKSTGLINQTKLWQRSYWDHIIRTKADYNRISDYIKNNPTRWVADHFHR